MRANRSFMTAVPALALGAALLALPAKAGAALPGAPKSADAAVPDVAVNLPDGKQVKLSSLWSDRPLLVTLFYNTCTGTCSPFLRSLKKAVDEAGGLGTDYRVVTLSFDPEDTLDDMQARAKELGIDKTDGWLIGTASPEDVKRVAEAVGFWYRYEPEADQYDHPSQVAAVRDGRIVRVLLGTTVAPRRFKDLLLEADGVFVPFYAQPGKEALFSCFAYDAATQSVRMNWGLLILLFPGVSAVFVAVLIFRRKR